MSDSGLFVPSDEQQNSTLDPQNQPMETTTAMNAGRNSPAHAATATVSAPAMHVDVDSDDDVDMQQMLSQAQPARRTPRPRMVTTAEIQALVHFSKSHFGYDEQDLLLTEDQQEAHLSEDLSQTQDYTSMMARLLAEQQRGCTSLGRLRNHLDGAEERPGSAGQGLIAADLSSDVRHLDSSAGTMAPPPGRDSRRASAASNSSDRRSPFSLPAQGRQAGSRSPDFPPPGVHTISRRSSNAGDTTGQQRFSRGALGSRTINTSLGAQEHVSSEASNQRLRSDGGGSGVQNRFRGRRADGSFPEEGNLQARPRALIDENHVGDDGYYQARIRAERTSQNDIFDQHTPASQYQGNEGRHRNESTKRSRNVSGQDDAQRSDKRRRPVENDGYSTLRRQDIPYRDADRTGHSEQSRAFEVSGPPSHSRAHDVSRNDVRCDSDTYDSRDFDERSRHGGQRPQRGSAGHPYEIEDYNDGDVYMADPVNDAYVQQRLKMQQRNSRGVAVAFGPGSLLEGRAARPFPTSRPQRANIQRTSDGDERCFEGKPSGMNGRQAAPAERDPLSYLAPSRNAAVRQGHSHDFDDFEEPHSQDHSGRSQSNDQGHESYGQGFRAHGSVPVSSSTPVDVDQRVFSSQDRLGYSDTSEYGELDDEDGEPRVASRRAPVGAALARDGQGLDNSTSRTAGAWINSAPEGGTQSARNAQYEAPDPTLVAQARHYNLMRTEGYIHINHDRALSMAIKIRKHINYQPRARNAGGNTTARDKVSLLTCTRQEFNAMSNEDRNRLLQQRIQRENIYIRACQMIMGTAEDEQCTWDIGQHTIISLTDYRTKRETGNSSGHMNPDNIFIILEHDMFNTSFEVISDILNTAYAFLGVKRKDKHVNDVPFSQVSVHGRYNRQAPRMTEKEGREWIDIQDRERLDGVQKGGKKAARSAPAIIKLEPAPEDQSGEEGTIQWTNGQIGVFDRIVQEYSEQRAQEVARRLTQELGFTVTKRDVARRFQQQPPPK